MISAVRSQYRRLTCRVNGHQWFGGPIEQSLQCVRCKEHRPWMNLNVYDCCEWLKDKP